MEDKTAYTNVTWIKPKRSWVDPLKDMLAIEKEIALNLTTQTEQAKAQGKDFEEILKTKQKEEELLKEYGLWIPPETDKTESNSPTQDIADAREFMEELSQRLTVLEQAK